MIFIHMDMEWFSQKLSAPAFNSGTNEKIYKPVGFVCAADVRRHCMQERGIRGSNLHFSLKFK